LLLGFSSPILDLENVTLTYGASGSVLQPGDRAEKIEVGVLAGVRFALLSQIAQADDAAFRRMARGVWGNDRERSSEQESASMAVSSKSHDDAGRDVDVRTINAGIQTRPADALRDYLHVVGPPWSGDLWEQLGEGDTRFKKPR
jgi:hypothetical protein